MIDTSKIIYSLNIEDVQNVATEELGRKLNNKELKIIENKIGDYIDWYESINMAITDNLKTKNRRSIGNEKTDED
ncbi:MAG: hypothetical protein KKG76_09505 [Euryarchaeota archaeon]|nr:hypothetical protein [Euryarchaeota archaeon]